MINGSHTHGIALHFAIISFLDGHRYIDFTEKIDSFKKTHPRFLEDLLRFKRGGKLLRPRDNFFETKADINQLLKTCSEFLEILESEEREIKPFFKNVSENIKATIGTIKKMQAVLTKVLEDAKK